MIVEIVRSAPVRVVNAIAGTPAKIIGVIPSPSVGPPVVPSIAKTKAQVPATTKTIAQINTAGREKERIVIIVGPVKIGVIIVVISA
jgi:hypothetical protein